MIYLFNPENDLALANFNPHFTAPSSARKMRHDLTILPIWYAPDKSLIIAEGDLQNSFLEELKSLLPINNALISLSHVADHSDHKVIPWGWSPAIRKQLILSGINEQSLPTITDIELLRNYSGRQNAVKLLRELKTWNLAFCGESYFYTDIDQLLVYLNVSNGDQVLKMPYSGSGKGIIWTKGDITDKQIDWCKRVLNTQGGVVVEPVLNKLQDFAMEFEITDSGVSFIGYSLFQSASSGAYIGSILLSDVDIENRLSMYVERSLLEKLKSKLETKLYEYFPKYRGYLGVDMMICQTSDLNYLIQPCVEVNMRMNMGIVAHRINERFVDPNSNGMFSINYFKKEGEALKQTLSIQSDNPPIIENGRIKSGYLALTPINKATQYTASISIKQNHERNSLFPS